MYLWPIDITFSYIQEGRQPAVISSHEDTNALGATYSSAKMASIHIPTNSKAEDAFQKAQDEHPWLLDPNTRLVCKPDQLIKRRGKNGLLGINLKWDAVKEWIRARAGKPFKV